MKQSHPQEEETAAAEPDMGSVECTGAEAMTRSKDASTATDLADNRSIKEARYGDPRALVFVKVEPAEPEVAVKSERSDDEEMSWEGDMSRYLTTVVTTEGEAPGEVAEGAEGAEGVPCELCGRKFRNKQGLSAHKNRIHYDTLPSQRRKPSYSVAASPELKCRVCRKQYVNRKSLAKHVKKEHLSNGGRGAHRCEECDKTFRLRNSLWMHRQSKHTPGDHRQLCEYCHRLLKSQRSYREHLLKKHPSVYLQREARGARVAALLGAAAGEAGGGGRGGGRVVDDAEAARLTRPHRCDLCAGEYVSATILRKHIASVHPPPDAERACPLCARSFKTELRLQGHLENKHSPLEERRRCEECAQVYKNKYSLQFHMKHSHGRRLPLGQGGLPCAPHEPLAARTRPRPRRRQPPPPHAEEAAELHQRLALMPESCGGGAAAAEEYILP